MAPVCVIAEATGVPGTVGAVVSDAAVVVKVTGAEVADRFPDTSLARTA